MALSMEIPCVEKKAEPLSGLDDRYRILSKLGSGSTGIVYRAVQLESGREVALKTLRSNDQGVVEAAEREYSLLKQLGAHPNIIKVLDFHNLCGEATLVLEFFDGATLQTVMKMAKSLPESTSRLLSASLYEAVGHLHGNNILHRDIKPDNVLVSQCLCNLRLIDFNAAACLNDGEPLTPTGTELYKAPELLLGESPCQRSDVWSSGLCTFFMLSGCLPQNRDTLDPSEYIKELVALQPTSFDSHHLQHVSDECKAMLQQCLAVQRADRPTMTELLENDWFSDPIMRRISFIGRMVPGAEAYLSVLSYAINAQAT